MWDAAARQFEAPAKRWARPGDLARHLDARTIDTPALELVDDFLMRAVATPDFRGIITLAPQEGKSKRVSEVFPTWYVSQINKNARIVSASYGQGLANRNGRAIRRNIDGHPELGVTIADDNGAVHDWSLSGHDGGVYSVGIGGGLTGRAADLMIIDDPIKDQKEADSETFRDNVWDWWESVAAARLAPGAAVIVILTRWHQDDLAGRLLGMPDSEWELLNIPAQAEHDPAKGETDVLGREPGEFLDSARRRTVPQWERRKREAGSRKWAAQYQGRPSAKAGDMFKVADWRYYDRPQWILDDRGSKVPYGFDRLLQSWDMTFKDTEGTDFVVGQVWGLRGADAYLLDQVRGRMSFPATIDAVKLLTGRWPSALLKVVEDKANGSAVIASLKHQIGGIVEEMPQGSKTARAAAITPLVEAHNVYLPAAVDADGEPFAPWVGDFVEEAASFPFGNHDDQVDAMSQALNRLVLQPLMPEETQRQPEEYDVVDQRGYWASPV